MELLQRYCKINKIKNCIFQKFKKLFCPEIDLTPKNETGMELESNLNDAKISYEFN